MNHDDLVAQHEAGHAVAATLLGVPVQLIDVRGNAAAHGFVRCEWPGERTDAYKRMLVVLSGPIASAKSFDEVPSWPLDPRRSSDERSLHELAEYLGLDERGYRRVVRDALDLACTPSFTQLFEAVTGLLDFAPVVDSHLLEQVMRISERR